MSEDKTIYKTTIVRKIIDERHNPPGWILTSPTTNEITGFFRDYELEDILKGKPAKRQITKLDGSHGFEFTNPDKKTSWYEAPEIGEMRDTLTFSSYPFRLKDELTIKIKQEKDTVTITITLENQ